MGGGGTSKGQEGGKDDTETFNESEENEEEK